MTRPAQPSLLTAAVLLLAAAAPTAGEEARLWEETGETGRGTLEPGEAPAVPPEQLLEADDAAREEVRRFWDRLLNKTTREIPPLLHRVPVEKAAGPSGPPSPLTLSTKAPSDFIFLLNSQPSAVAPAGFNSIVPEPSVAAVGDQVFYAGNWFAASSSDGGASFAYVNSFAGPFPAPASGGFCCDQVVTYDPSHDTLFFLQQYINDVATGVQRINVDAGADGTFDCFYDVTPQILGFAANNFPDFPDLAVSDGHLYHSSNVFSTLGGGFTGAFVARYPLDDLAACGSIPFDVYQDVGGFFSFKLTRGASDTMYFADHISNASLRIWRWPDAVAAPISFDRAVGTWTEASRTCPGPDARDWCGFLDRRMMGAYVADGEVGFFWVPAQGGGFAFPYTRIAQFSEAALVLTGEPIIWSPSFAWAYPSVAVNRNGDLGGTITAGGGVSLHPSCVAWIADDTNGDTIAPLENQVASFGASGPSINRSGDYNSTATYYPNDYLWAGACYSYPDPDQATSRYVLFGREGNSQLIFTDGFESGDTTSWTASVP